MQELRRTESAVQREGIHSCFYSTNEEQVNERKRESEKEKRKSVY